MEEDKKYIDVKIEITETKCSRKPNYGRIAIIFSLCGVVFGGIPYFGVAYIIFCFVLVIKAFRQRFSIAAFFAAIIVALMAYVKYVFITTL